MLGQGLERVGTHQHGIAFVENLIRVALPLRAPTQNLCQRRFERTPARLELHRLGNSFRARLAPE